MVASISFWERAAFWGLTAPWRMSLVLQLLSKNSHPSLLTRPRVENYMEHSPRRDSGETPGALGLGQANATRIYCAFYIFYYTTPIFFAVVADSYLS